MYFILHAIQLSAFLSFTSDALFLFNSFQHIFCCLHNKKSDAAKKVKTLHDIFVSVVIFDSEYVLFILAKHIQADKITLFQYGVVHTSVAK